MKRKTGEFGYIGVFFLYIDIVQLIYRGKMKWKLNVFGNIMETIVYYMQRIT